MEDLLDGDLTGFMSAMQWRAVENAAVLSLADRHSEAEATRYAANYHNLDTRCDADGHALG